MFQRGIAFLSSVPMHQFVYGVPTRPWTMIMVRRLLPWPGRGTHVWFPVVSTLLSSVAHKPSMRKYQYGEQVFAHHMLQTQVALQSTHTAIDIGMLIQYVLVGLRLCHRPRKKQSHSLWFVLHLVGLICFQRCCCHSVPIAWARGPGWGCSSECYEFSFSRRALNAWCILIDLCVGSMSSEVGAPLLRMVGLRF